MTTVELLGPRLSEFNFEHRDELHALYKRVKSERVRQYLQHALARNVAPLSVVQQLDNADLAQAYLLLRHQISRVAIAHLIWLRALGWDEFTARVRAAKKVAQRLMRSLDHTDPAKWSASKQAHEIKAHLYRVIGEQIGIGPAAAFYAMLYHVRKARALGRPDTATENILRLACSWMIDMPPRYEESER